MKFVLGIITTILVLAACQSSKRFDKTSQNKEELAVVNNFGLDNQDSIVIYCNRDTLVLVGRDKLSLSYQLKRKAIGQCIFDKAFSGDKNMEKLLHESLQLVYKQHGVVRFPSKETKLRGWPIFRFLMELANNFDCVPSGGDVITDAYFYLYSKYIWEMIKSIDNDPPKKYLDKQREGLTMENDPRTKDALSEEWTCGRYNAEYQYNIIKKSIEDDLVILKDYGEE